MLFLAISLNLALNVSHEWRSLCFEREQGSVISLFERLTGFSVQISIHQLFGSLNSFILKLSDSWNHFSFSLQIKKSNSQKIILLNNETLHPQDTKAPKKLFIRSWNYFFKGEKTFTTLFNNFLQIINFLYRRYNINVYIISKTKHNIKYFVHSTATVIL